MAISELLSLLALFVASSGLPGPSPHGDGQAKGEEKRENVPTWALAEAYSCAACHELADERGLGLIPHAPSLTQGWYRSGFVTEYIARAHATERTPAPPLPQDADQSESARAGLAAYFRSTALEGSSIELDLTALEAGRQLYHAAGCIACHAPFEDFETLEQKLWEFEELFSSDSERSPFPDLGDKFVSNGLAPYLASSVGHAPALPLEDGEAQLLANYIWFEEMGRSGAEIESGEGLLYEYYEGRFTSYDLQAEGNAIVRRGVTPTPILIDQREDNYAFRFRGFVEVPTTGFYTFTTVSDDGSWLWINNEVVVNNAGLHGPQEKQERLRLETGKHAIEIGFFEHTGGAELAVYWEGPGVARELLPASALSHKRISVNEPEATTNAGGKGDPRFLSALGCAACHDAEGTHRPAKPLRALRANAGGCLAPTPRAGLPRYEMNATTRDLFVQLLEGKRATPAPKEHLAALMEHKGCIQCHLRDGTGGPTRERMAYFQVDSHAELGDEGRIPPHLDGAGSKLHTEWMHEVIRDGARSRPYMRTRMPAFPEDAERFTRLFQELDASAADLVEPDFDVELVPIGRRLVGTGGLGCIQCHDLAGYPSLGVPAVDLARVHERIKPAWFKQLLLDPIAINMNTRMPTFWTDGKSPVADVFDGDPAQQIDAIWTYLALGSSMPLPEGLIAQDSDYELDAAHRPTLVSVFADGLSPRTLFVGYPERIHAAFDVQNSRLALAWRGRFFNARGTWHGRAGELEGPDGEEVLEFPSGPPFARLSEASARWPQTMGPEGGYRVLGRRFDEDRRPIFRYALGSIEIEERIIPKLGKDGGTLLRKFQLHSSTREDGLYFRAMTQPDAADAKTRVTVAGAQLLVEGRDTLIPVSFQRDGESYSADFSVEVSW